MSRNQNNTEVDSCLKFWIIKNLYTDSSLIILEYKFEK